MLILLLDVVEDLFFSIPSKKAIVDYNLYHSPSFKHIHSKSLKISPIFAIDTGINKHGIVNRLAILNKKYAVMLNIN